MWLWLLNWRLFRLRSQAQSLHGTFALSEQYLVISQVPASVSHPCPVGEVPCCGNHCRRFDVLAYLSVFLSRLSLWNSVLSPLSSSTPPLAYSYSSACALGALGHREVTGAVSEMPGCCLNGSVTLDRASVTSFVR